MTDAPILQRRAVPEWVGATPDSAIPRIVKGRIWAREGGRCYLTGRKINAGDAFDYEHVRSIRNGGENRESNIRLALRDKHREKTAEEASEGAKADRIHAKHFGYFPKPKRKLEGRGFDRRPTISQAQNVSERTGEVGAEGDTRPNPNTSSRTQGAQRP